MVVDSLWEIREPYWEYMMLRQCDTYGINIVYWYIKNTKDEIIDTVSMPLEIYVNLVEANLIEDNIIIIEEAKRNHKHIWDRDKAISKAIHNYEMREFNGVLND